MSIFFDHHIILERFRNHPAFRDIDKETFDIDSPANRIYLPADRNLAAKLNVSPHPGRHVSSYVEAVCKTLHHIAQTPSPSDRAEEIRNLIDAMRIGFANEDLYVNVPIGKTDEDVALGIERVFKDYRAYRDRYPDKLRKIKELEQRGADSGLQHLIKWWLYLDNAEKEKLIDEVIARNPGVNVTSGNRDLDGTRWRSKFAATDPSSSGFRTPGSAPVNATDFPPLPGYNSPALAGLNEPEGFRRSDPRFTGVLPPSLAPSPNERQLGQLPPTTAAPTDPLVLRFDPMTGAPLPFYENPLMRDAPGNGSSLAQDILPWLAGGAALGIAAPFVPAWLAAILAGLALTSRVANAQEPGSGAASDIVTDPGGVFSTGAPAFNAFINGGMAGNTTRSGDLVSPMPGSPLSQRAPLGQDAGSGGSVSDRFGNWTDTPVDTRSVAPSNAPGAPLAADAVAPEEVRRLTRVNASNAGSVFTSGSTPVPYLPSTEFDDRFGNWTVPTADGRSRQTSGPIGGLANEPSYVIQPPIFGVDDPGNPRNDADEWFSRWIRPLLRPE
ncbi:AHH domain-containing protein [Bradyrhizobium sp. SEMIA]|uniref:AHH domain-containing protein n=1 Tax=Bradyrhizobium sp. SEMIA TaxID=2597515 RepID=UPI0018A4114C|nr:AHH domain-containing protein [Bradyrhizobium sp. SEMIA]QOG18601.1 hypothetical protein FOM02_15900 [Bradyrhizobium sp. SEMIA]